ncbi:MAG: hypothetical protein EOO02_20370 [Chitinophagaceae bacterium]|nr:MAG: hypothetical protein EOO02_20370 [Chitinophagaceae bacterium]
MKKLVPLKVTALVVLCCLTMTAASQTRVVKKGNIYDTIIVKRTPAAKKPASKPVAPKEVILPVPEFINQPYYFDKDANRLITLDNTNGKLVTKKKTLGIKGARQLLNMEGSASRIRFIAKKEINFIIKTSGDVIDLTSYIRLYHFLPVEQRREVTLGSKEGVLNDKEEAKGKQVPFSLKMITKDNYLVQLDNALEAGEYGFVWMKNMDLKEVTVFAFGIDWKSSD